MDIDPAVDPPTPAVETPPAVDPPPAWKSLKDSCQNILLQKAEKFGLRQLKDTDHMPKELKKQIYNFGSLVLIREGTKGADRDDPLREHLEYTLSIDPGMNTFLVCWCPWTGDEYWIGFGVGDHIGDLLDKISAIESKIGTDAETSPAVKKQEKCAIQCAMEHVNSSRSNSKKTYDARKDAEKALLVLKAQVTKSLREALYQDELDDLRGKIQHLQTKLHNIASQFVSAWSQIIIPRFDLTNMVKCGKVNELGDKQKAILAYLAHCKFLTRLRTSVAKNGNDIVEVTECGSTKNCSDCNSKNSPRFDRFYHCRHCKLKMTRDGNAAKNIFKFALATVLIYLSDSYPNIWKYLDTDDGDESDSDVENDDELDVEGDWIMDDREEEEEYDRKRKNNEFDGDGSDRTVPVAKKRTREVSGKGSKDDEAGGESDVGKSRVVGSDSMEYHAPLLSSNVLPYRLISRAAHTSAVDSKEGKTRISIQP
jgi:hypothetical protein